MVKSFKDLNIGEDDSVGDLINVLKTNLDLKADQSGLDATNASLAEKANQVDVDNTNLQIDNISVNSKRILKGLTGNSESGHYDIWDYTKLFNGEMRLSNAGEGWINTSGIVNPWVKMNMSIGVVIGDSTAEGHPNTHGRLHQSDGSVNLNALNVPGQISYHIEQYTKLKTYNQGIGGQTTAQVRARWIRDVLAQTVAVGDGKPDDTLPKIPNFVIMSVGINDVYQNRSAADIETDLGWMIDSAISNNIFPIVCNILPDGTDNLNATQLSIQKSVNAWLIDKQKSTPQMALIDLYNYLNDPADDGHPLAGLTADNLHPTKTTYERIARKIIDEAFTEQYPAVVPRFLNFSSAFNLTAYTANIARPIAVLLSINDVPYRYSLLPNNPDQCIPIPYTDGFIDTITVYIIDHENAFEASGTGAYKGWAEIYLTDRNIFAEKFDSFIYNGWHSRIVPFPTDAGGIGVVSGRAAMLSGTTPGNITYANAANIVGSIGTFAVTSAATSYVATSGLCQVQVDNTVYLGDFLVTTGTGGVCTRSTSPASGAIVAQVVRGRTGAGVCLAKRV